MTTTPAMPEPLGWYVVNNIGMATLCKDEAEAQLLAEDCDMVYQRQAPHRAVQLVALAALQAQPAAAGVSDADVWELWLRVCAESDNVSTRVMIANFARAILALRQHAVPMTKGQVKQAVRFFSASTPRDVDDWIESIIRYAEEFHRITVPGRAEG